MQTQLLSLTPKDVSAWTEQLLNIYRLAFAAPPYNGTEEGVQNFAQTLISHSQRSGFCLYAAYGKEEQKLVGFTYGYTSQPGQWWHDTIIRAMSPTMAQKWLSYALELVELAVMPEAQGYGIGGQLHDALLRDAPQRTALLSTYDGETNGMHLYRKRGWITLLSPYYYPNGDKPMVIMGRQLHQ